MWKLSCVSLSHFTKSVVQAHTESAVFKVFILKGVFFFFLNVLNHSLLAENKWTQNKIRFSKYINIRVAFSL